MVSFFSQSFYYDHPWTLVHMGVWRKYPNPQSAHVVSVDVLDRTVDPSTGIVRTERVIGCTQKAPRWVVKILGGTTDAYVREVSHLDPRTGETHVTSVNLSLSQYLTVLEHISYKPCPTMPTQRTLFTQTAEIQARIAGWRPLQERFELWSLETFNKNAQKGREGFEHVLSLLRESRRQGRLEQ
ncbi:related to protein involved in intramitochondrial protein sorting [Serendipita indica DSM 11827]|uniref:Related to protein involved in intramitochondrial protein sorting n=1 Tax=Serendipita indica (strain DSM 11827) TaxID=1109443 RepID=G4U331_SERID|nr:related to protein involved in intramitochondrial protein sorting [Serendipita indica DSM 11827]